MTIAEKSARLRDEIAAACLLCGRPAEDVRFMAVSKFQPKSAAAEAYAAGLRLFGESRAQEALQKFSGRAAEFPGCELHMIGALQRNKAKAACELFDCVQSVDRPELIAELGKHAAAREKPLDILFELNAGEESKSGYRRADDLYAATEAALAFPGLRVRGLMTMAPFINDERAIRGAFRALRKTRDALAARFGGAASFPELSMGMSGDFKIAIEEGATLVRIGTALFGERTG